MHHLTDQGFSFWRLSLKKVMNYVAGNKCCTPAVQENPPHLGCAKNIVNHPHVAVVARGYSFP